MAVVPGLGSVIVNRVQSRTVTRAMAEDPLHQPHDKLFKLGFSDPATAAGFLRHQLPPAIAKAIAWESLRPEAGSFVDSQFRASESDLLFSAPAAGETALLYLLFEHQRLPDPWIALRLLRYQVRIWESRLPTLAAGEKLPLILPVVLAQNVERWEIATRFADLLAYPAGWQTALAGQIPDYCFRLVQLAELPFERIVGTPAGILVLRTLKAEQLDCLLGPEVWDEALILQARAVFEHILRYIVTRADVDSASFTRRVERVQSLELKQTAMTLAEQFHQKGHQQGSLAAQRRAVVAVLEERFDRVPSGIGEALDLIHDYGRLCALHRRAVRAADLEAFAREL